MGTRLKQRQQGANQLQDIAGLCYFVHVFFVQVTILNFVRRSRRAEAPRCAQFSIDICCVIQEGVITVEKCAHRGALGAPHVVTWTKQTWK